MEKMENNGENSGPLTSLPVDRLTATDCNAAARAKKENIESKRISEAEKSLIDKLEVKNQEIRDLHSEREDLQYKYDEHINSG